MESENEGSPLLHSLEPPSWKENFRRRCLKIPSEITITGIILGLFLIVVTLLILLQNLQSSAPSNDLVLEKTLLGSSMTFDKKNLEKLFEDKENGTKKSKDKDKNKDKSVDKRTERTSTVKALESPMKFGQNEKKSFEEKDGKSKNKDKNKDKNVDKRTERLSTVQVLESPFKFNKKDLDTSWKENKDKFVPKDHAHKWDKIDEGWKEMTSNDLLGSPFKFNKKDFDLTWKYKKNSFKPDENYMNWDPMNINWQPHSVNLLGSPFKYNKKELDTSWQEKKDKYRPAEKVQKWDNVDKGWKQLSISNLLGSPLKYNKKELDESWQDKKAKYRPDENDQKWDNVDKGWKKLSIDSLLDPSNELIEEAFDESLRDMTNIMDSSGKKWDNVKKGWKHISDGFLLGSPAKYDKKDFKESDEDSESEEELPSKKWNNVDKGWQRLISAGWKGKEIKAALLESWIESQDTLISVLNSADVKWDTVDDGWKALAEQGWSDMEIKEALIHAWKKAIRILKSRLAFDNKTWKNVNEGWRKFSNRSLSVAAPSSCPLSMMNSAHLLGASIPQAQIDCALIAEEVRKRLGECVDLSFLPQECKPVWRTKCFTTYKYRKQDGTCNNKIHPTWGQAGTPFVRMTEPDYSDGVSAIRKAKSGKDLPNARLLSRTLYSKRMKPDSNATMLFLNFGLLVDHDMVQTAIQSDSIPCCEEQFEMYPQSRPRECLQIAVPDDDPFYGPRGVKCLNLWRSTPIHGECMGRREQLNKATSFLDASTVYGSTIQQTKALRSFNKGELRMQMINNAPFMSYAEAAGYSCGTPAEPLKCFEAGDSRVNMLVELTAMLTIWYREHNRIAQGLHKLNSQWTDELLFQEARRILVAELQHIAYREFLPVLLGDKALDDYELRLDEEKLYGGYDDTVDPGVFNVFGAAAFRFGHSLAQDSLELLGPENRAQGQVPLHETFFNAQLLYHNGLDLLLRGAALQRTQSVDSYITPEVREHLFQPAGLDYGHDLAAVSIQRGRDHGLPAYPKWREVCGLSPVEEWDDLYDVMDEERVDALKAVYESVADIDLIPGALAELHVRGSLLGPTYLCIIGRQFKKTRKGDRFWFENQNQTGSFSKGQLEEIYKSSMARIVCDNSDDIKNVQKHPFKVPSDENPIISCEEIPAVDLSKWKL